MASLVANFTDSLDRLSPGPTIGVAVSGGSDSTALLLLGAGWARRRRAALTALTVDHGLRPEAAMEAEQVARICAEIDVPHRTVTLTAPAPAANLQHWAREQRYRQLLDWARANAAALLIGHTRDDQAETVLMRLAHGSSVFGLAAMAPESCRDGVRILRPLLGVSRARLRQYLRRRRQGWVEDPANEDPRFSRTVARKALAALAPLGITAAGLATTAESMGRVRAVLEQHCQDFMRTAVGYGALGEARLCRAAFADIETETGLRALDLVLRRVSGNVTAPGFAALAALYGWLCSSEPPQRRTLHGCQLSRLGTGDVRVERELAACEGAICLEAGTERIWDRRWRVRTAPGAASCEVAALGAEDERRISAARREWSRAARGVRRSVPAFRRDGVLLAVPAAGIHSGGVRPYGEAWLAASSRAGGPAP